MHSLYLTHCTVANMRTICHLYFYELKYMPCVFLRVIIKYYKVYQNDSYRTYQFQVFHQNVIRKLLVLWSLETDQYHDFDSLYWILCHYNCIYLVHLLLKDCMHPVYLTHCNLYSAKYENNIRAYYNKTTIWYKLVYS